MKALNCIQWWICKANHAEKAYYAFMVWPFTEMKINHFSFFPLSFRIYISASVCACVFIHIISVCTFIQQFTEMNKCDKVIELTVMHNEHIRVVSTAKPLFSVSYFIRARACGFPQGIRQRILVLQHLIIYFIKTLTFPTSLGSLVRLIIKHSKIELLQFMCMYIYSSWGMQYVLLVSTSEPCPE